MTDSLCCAHPKLALGKQNGQDSNSKNTKSIHPEVFMIAWLLNRLLGLSMCTKTARQSEQACKMDAQITMPIHRTDTQEVHSVHTAACTSLHASESMLDC